ncbi:putative pectinesterase 29 [Wolffia australiana]
MAFAWRFLAVFLVAMSTAAAGLDVISIYVNQSGQAQFKTIQAAIDSVPNKNNRWIRIHVARGVYREQVMVSIQKSFIMLEGEGKDQTFIEWSAHASPTVSDPETAAFSLMAPNFVAKRITFKNAYRGETAAPALAAIIWSDKAAFYDCGFVGYQDTLCDMSGRHYFKDCRIEGAVDFIFGIGRSIYDSCAIVSTGDGWITAHGRNSANDTSGYVFKNCNITGTGKTHLGRPWGPLSTVIYYESFMADIVVPQGWEAWFQSNHLAEITYVESGCSGPGSDTSSRVSWEKKLNQSVLEKYINMSYINHDGWLEKQP